MEAEKGSITKSTFFFFLTCQTITIIEFNLIKTSHLYGKISRLCQSYSSASYACNESFFFFLQNLTKINYVTIIHGTRSA